MNSAGVFAILLVVVLVLVGCFVYTTTVTHEEAASEAKDARAHDGAIADSTEAIRLDPKDAVAFNNRGNAWYGRKDYDGAIADYDEAIRLDPKNAMAYYNRGRAWYAKGEYDRAIADSGCTSASDFFRCELGRLGSTCEGTTRRAS